jgi:two-component system sensor histidine kinase DesK
VTDPQSDCIAHTNAGVKREAWRHTSGWQRWVFPSFWLVYLGQTLGGIGKHSDGFVSLLGIAILLAFCVAYLWALPMGWSNQRSALLKALGVMVILTAAEAVIAHEDAFVMCVFIGVLCMAGLGRWSFPAVLLLTVVSVFTPPLIPSWHSGPVWYLAVTLPLVAFAMYGFFALIRNNRALSEARSEVARLAAENERSRIARDLHDLLGHSLTTITVKAGLARRLAEIDPVRAAVEISEVEELTRSTLMDVRAAVAGYREVTLAGELASAHEVLRASGIEAQLPRAVDAVPAAYRELFGWVVREGVTNVVRHSRAQAATITVGATFLEIADDGRGGPVVNGSGLSGLTERVAAAAGTVTAGPGPSGGWTLRVDLPPAPPVRRPTAVSPFDPIDNAVATKFVGS